MTQHAFRVDDVVDIVIRGAVVDHHGDHTLIVTMPGVDEQITIPIVADNGHPMRQVIVTPSPVMRALGGTIRPAGPGIGGRSLHTAVTDAVLQGLPQPAGTGTSDELGRWIRLHTVDDARAWARALGLGGDTGTWGDDQVVLTVATVHLADGYRHVPGLLDDGSDLDPETGPVDDLDLSTLGQDYIKDPAARIAGIREIAPEFVAIVDAVPTTWTTHRHDGTDWQVTTEPASNGGEQL